MIDNIITAYLRSNKRLVVPEFGAFIHKDDGEVVFVEFLKKDDGALAGLLRREYSVNETEARGIIDEYVSNIRRTVATTGKYAVEGLGTLRTDANGLYALSYDPRVRREHVEMPSAAIEEPTPKPEEPVMHVVTREVVVEEKSAPSVSDDIIMNVFEDKVESREQPDNTIEFVFSTREPVREPKSPKQPQPEEKKVFTLNDLYSIPANEERTTERQSPRPAVHTPKLQERPAEHARRHETHQADDIRLPDSRPAAKHPRNHTAHPADSVRHNEARPTTNAPRPQHKAQRPQTRPANRRSGGRSKTDWVMIIAIAVALIALGTMIYGMFVRQSPDIRPTNAPIENVEGVENGAEIIDGDTNVELPTNEG